MQIMPILVALRRHKAGTWLIALQIALTLAIVCNALFIIQQRVARLSRPSGVTEAGLLVIENQWADKSGLDTDARIRADLLALRQTSSVQDATAMNSYPLRGSGWDNFVKLTAEQVQPSAGAAIYFADEHTLATLGVRLLEGRNFRADEVTSQPMRDKLSPPAVIISKALAEQLFPGRSAVGRTIYVSLNSGPATVIGVSDTLQAHSVSQWASRIVYNAVLIPARLIGGSTVYLVRARPGQFAAAWRDAPRQLLAQIPLRIIDPEQGELSFAQVRQRAYDSDRGMAVLMAIISVVLLGITAAGIVGLTSFWVGQRRKQIGVRRALGATRRDILGYFLTENLLIGCGGVLLGTLLAFAINLWMVQRYEMLRLSVDHVVIGVLALLLLGQLAALAPALRAAQVPPVEATRTV